ncbi:hypothetical protein B0H14DRAFT_3491662 [Mycena olivaceomarginata]|nr:hypothetical protein B0H14DRAFT_3491662 [Mycena olivaceomarginata]
MRDTGDPHTRCRAPHPLLDATRDLRDGVPRRRTSLLNVRALARSTPTRLHARPVETTPATGRMRPQLGPFRLGSGFVSGARAHASRHGSSTLVPHSPPFAPRLPTPLLTLRHDRAHCASTSNPGTRLGSLRSPTYAAPRHPPRRPRPRSTALNAPRPLRLDVRRTHALRLAEVAYSPSKRVRSGGHIMPSTAHLARVAHPLRVYVRPRHTLRLAEVAYRPSRTACRPHCPSGECHVNAIQPGFSNDRAADPDCSAAEGVHASPSVRATPPPREMEAVGELWEQRWRDETAGLSRAVTSSLHGPPARRVFWRWGAPSPHLVHDDPCAAACVWLAPADLTLEASMLHRTQRPIRYGPLPAMLACSPCPRLPCHWRKGSPEFALTRSTGVSYSRSRLRVCYENPELSCDYKSSTGSHIACASRFYPSRDPRFIDPGARVLIAAFVVLGSPSGSSANSVLSTTLVDQVISQLIPCNPDEQRSVDVDVQSRWHPRRTSTPSPLLAATSISRSSSAPWSLRAVRLFTSLSAQLLRVMHVRICRVDSSWCLSGYTKSGREATTLVDGGDPPSDPGSALAALSSKVSSSEKLTRSKPGRFTSPGGQSYPADDGTPQFWIQLEPLFGAPLSRVLPLGFLGRNPNPHPKPKAPICATR